MRFDIVDLQAFYAKPLGQYAMRLLAGRLAAYWPRHAPASANPKRKERMVGLGYALPFMAHLWPHAEWAAFMPPQLGTRTQPDIQSDIQPNMSRNRACLIDEYALPLADNSIDRILLLHMLEMVADPEAVLGEIWRVLAPGGRLLLGVPNRYGVWAHSDLTPWHCGRSFSKGQMRRLLRKTDFTDFKAQACFVAPPPVLPFMMRTLASVETIGCRLWPLFCGLLIVEASKQVYAPIGKKTTRPSRLASIVRPALAQNFTQNK